MICVFARVSQLLSACKKISNLHILMSFIVRQTQYICESCIYPLSSRFSTSAYSSYYPVESSIQLPDGLDRRVLLIVFKELNICFH